MELGDELRLVCYEGDLEKLLAELAVHRLDLVVSDQSIPPGLSVRAFNHVLGESEVSFFAPADRAPEYESTFPDCLDQAPVLLPVRGNTLRRRLDDWFEQVRRVRDCSPRPARSRVKSPHLANQLRLDDFMSFGGHP